MVLGEASYGFRWNLAFGGLFLLHCNYDIKEVHISSKFYSELLQWWCDFRNVFCSRKLGGTVILYNELKLFVSLNCFNVDNLLLNFSQSRLAVSL